MEGKLGGEGVKLGGEGVKLGGEGFEGRVIECP